MIELRPLIGNRTPTKVKINTIIKTYLGLSVYANQTWLSRFIPQLKLSNLMLAQFSKLSPN